MKDRATYQNARINASGCRSVVLRCMDFRFSFYLRSMLDQLDSGFGDFDDISLPGGARALLQEGTQVVCLSSLRKALEHHGATRLLLISHRDCLGYGRSTSYASAAAEKEAVVADLRRARELVQSFFPNKFQVTLLFFDRDALEVIN